MLLQYAWHRFKDIILPSISTIVVLNLIISVSGALSAFEMPYVVTGGGFNTSTYFVVMDKIAHTDQKVGLASAMAVVLLLLIVIVTYAQKAVEKWLKNDSFPALSNGYPFRDDGVDSRSGSRLRILPARIK